MWITFPQRVENFSKNADKFRPVLWENPQVKRTSWSVKCEARLKFAVKKRAARGVLRKEAVLRRQSPAQKDMKPA